MYVSLKTLYFVLLMFMRFEKITLFSFTSNVFSLFFELVYHKRLSLKHSVSSFNKINKNLFCGEWEGMNPLLQIRGSIEIVNLRCVKLVHSQRLPFWRYVFSNLISADVKNISQFICMHILSIFKI